MFERSCFLIIFSLKHLFTCLAFPMSGTCVVISLINWERKYDLLWSDNGSYVDPEKGYIVLWWNSSFLSNGEPHHENMQTAMSDYFLGVSDGEARQKISLLTMTAAQGPQTSPSLTTCRHFWWTVFFCQRQPVCEEKRDLYHRIGYYCLDLL